MKLKIFLDEKKKKIMEKHCDWKNGEDRKHFFHDRDQSLMGGNIFNVLFFFFLSEIPISRKQEQSGCPQQAWGVWQPADVQGIISVCSPLRRMCQKLQWKVDALFLLSLPLFTPTHPPPVSDPCFLKFPTS